MSWVRVGLDFGFYGFLSVFSGIATYYYPVLLCVITKSVIIPAYGYLYCLCSSVSHWIYAEQSHRRVRQSIYAKLGKQGKVGPSARKTLAF